MKFVTNIFVFSSISFLAVSCVAPVSQSNAGNAANGTFQDPNNPYAVPGVSTQGVGYDPAAQAQIPAQSAPYQSILSTAVNPPATIPTYTPPAYTPSAASSTVSSGGSSHTVASNDTLWGLSRKYGVSVDQIRQANNISGDLIVTGQTLTIPN